MTDIHDLDRHIGKYVDFQDGEDGASGFLVDVLDAVDYIPEPVRWVTLDWGQGWRVGTSTVLTFPRAPEGQRCEIVGPVRRAHLAMHGDRKCSALDICTYEGMAVRAVRETRLWRQRQDRAYWQWKYLRKARQESVAGIEGLICEAVSESTPAEFVDHLQIVKQKALKKEGRN